MNFGQLNQLNKNTREVEELKTRVEELEKLVQELTAKRGPGRPRKVSGTSN